jgi:hypothetical protein
MKPIKIKLYLSIAIVIAGILVFLIVGYLKSDDIYYGNLIRANNLKTPNEVFLWAVKKYNIPHRGDPVVSYLSPKYLMMNRERLFCDEGAIVMATLDHELGFKTRLINLCGYDNISHHTVLQVKENGSWNTYDFTYRIINRPFKTCSALYGFKVKTPRINPYPKFYNKIVNNNYYLKAFIFKMRNIPEI